jgi:hypothetical protein
MFNKIALNVAGFLVGTIASFQAVGCLVQPMNQMHHVVARMADSSEGEREVLLFDFTAPDADVSGWVESSDTVRQPGMSKAAIVLQKSQLFQRAVFFGLLNPQPNGAGFAGVRHSTDFDLSKFSSVEVKLRGQGNNKNFKLYLKHHGEVGDASPSYENFFQAPANEFQVLSLPLSDFKPYWRGQQLPDAEPLDTTSITSVGIQFYGGVYEEGKQSGPSTLEIDWIKAKV